MLARQQRIEHTEKLKEAYLEFLKDDSRVLSGALKSYKFDKGEIIIHVFSYEPESKLITEVDGVDHGDPPMYFGVGKVLGGSEDVLEKYPPGSHVSLRDSESATIINPRYDIWVNNDMNNSNAEKVGQEPPKYMSNMGKLQGNNFFVVDKIKVGVDNIDFDTLRLREANIVCSLENPEELIADIDIKELEKEEAEERERREKNKKKNSKSAKLQKLKSKTAKKPVREVIKD